MAKSQRRTTIAILRGILGPAAGKEERFAQLANRSVSWVKKASAGLLPVSEETAKVLQLETGISFCWLMGPADKLPVDTRGKPYRRERYQFIRARTFAGLPAVSQTSFKPLAFLPDIAAIGSAAGDHGKAAIFLWRLKSFIEAQREQFGSDEEVYRFVSRLLADNPKVSNFDIHDKGLNVAEVDSLVQRTVEAAKKLNENQSQRSSRKIRKGKSTKTPLRHARSRRGGSA